PPGLHDRAADNWRPLLAVADLAGDAWPERARRAARLLSGEGATEDDSARVTLLADLRALFEEFGEKVRSATLLERLGAMEERPWGEWKGGKPMTAPQLARLLKPYEIRPRTLSLGEERPKGYHRADFEDAFRRYLPARAATPQPAKDSEDLSSDDAATGASRLRLRDGEFPCDSAEVAAVAPLEGADAEEILEWTA
ncbi:MAG: DUF3631 domain-containing protein, partial [Candidatus Methylomirabilis sp.]|nr:DUF3631 domain-containing protein [Deltaproteobacteria bacterium]